MQSSWEALRQWHFKQAHTHARAHANMLLQVGTCLTNFTACEGTKSRLKGRQESFTFLKMHISNGLLLAKVHLSCWAMASDTEDKSCRYLLGSTDAHCSEPLFIWWLVILKWSQTKKNTVWRPPNCKKWRKCRIQMLKRRTTWLCTC